MARVSIRLTKVLRHRRRHRLNQLPTQSAPSYVAPASSSGDDPWGGGADPGWVSPLDSPPVSTPHQDAAQGSAPGWYPEGGDNSLMRYWDGSKFTGRRRWDGSAWVEA